MNIYKKLFLFLIPVSLLSFGFASNISQANKTKMDNIVSAVDVSFGKEPIISQISKYEKLINAFSMAKLKDKEQQQMILYLVERLKKKLNTLKSQVNTQDKVISNVDRSKVKQEWLSWHNEERSKKGLAPYTYSETLNYTSLIRAQQIASEKRKTGTTHARKSSDGYRNTDSIRERFSDLGVDVIYFSESNAYGYYNCKKADCTQEMIDVLKKCFNRTILDGSHRPAVVSSTYDQIGLGVAINGTYIRLTTHYGKNIK